MSESLKFLQKMNRPFWFIFLGILGVFVASFIIVAFSPLYVVFLLAGVVAMILIIRRPLWGLLLLAFLIPIEVLSLLYFSSISVLRFITMGITLAWILKFFSNRSSINFSKHSLWYLFFFIWALLSLFWAPFPEVGFRFVFTFIQFFVIILIIIDQVRTLSHLKMVFIALLAGGLLEIVLFYFLGEYNYQYRMVLASLFDGQGLASYAYPLAFSLVLMGILGFLGSGWPRIVGVFGFLLGLYPMIATGLRGALLVVIIGLSSGVIIVLSKKGWSGIITLIIILVLFLGFMNIILSSDIFPPELIRRLTIASALESDGSERFNIWKVVFDVVPKNLLFGLGLNQFSSFVVSKNLFHYVGTHNDYMEALVSFGLVGAFLFITGDIVALISIIRVRRHVKKQDLVWFAALLALIIGSIVGQNFVNQLYWKYVWVIRAIVIAGSSPTMWSGEMDCS